MSIALIFSIAARVAMEWFGPRIAEGAKIEMTKRRSGLVFSHALVTGFRFKPATRAQVQLFNS